MNSSTIGSLIHPNASDLIKFSPLLFFEFNQDHLGLNLYHTAFSRNLAFYVTGKITLTMNYDQITGVILAGGKSSRMGRDKAFLDLHGTPMVAHVINAMKQVFDRTIIIANDQKRYSLFNLEVFTDVYRECGPLGGIHSAFFHTTSDSIFISGCDTPNVPPELMRLICEFPSPAIAKVPYAEGRVHPLIGLYDRKCMPAILSHLESRRLKMTGFLDMINTAKIPISESFLFSHPGLFHNINDESERVYQDDL